MPLVAIRGDAGGRQWRPQARRPGAVVEKRAVGAGCKKIVQGAYRRKSQSPPPEPDRARPQRLGVAMQMHDGALRRQAGSEFAHAPPGIAVPQGLDRRSRGAGRTSTTDAGRGILPPAGPGQLRRQADRPRRGIVTSTPDVGEAERPRRSRPCGATLDVAEIVEDDDRRVQAHHRPAGRRAAVRGGGACFSSLPSHCPRRRPDVDPRPLDQPFGDA